MKRGPTVSLHFVLKLEVDGIPGSHTPQEHPDVFEDRFSRSCPLLQFLAYRILTCNEEVEKAMQNCRLTASQNPPRFEHEGAFRSWLARVLIDEALALVRQRKAALL
jgi:DNA-directed RNA polymerase specialized sigma24 family protein